MSKVGCITTKAYDNKHKKKIRDVISSINDVGGVDNIDGNIKNLLNLSKVAKSKNLTNSKKLNLAKVKNSDFAKANYSKTDFLPSKAKNAFTHL